MQEPSRSTIRDRIDAVVAELTTAGIAVTVDHSVYRLPAR